MIQIQLQDFEGPLALLLYLIKKEEMDIFDIRISEITQQYLEYIKFMKELDLEVAGEFVAMAATLIQIKSRMLLPQYNEHGEVIEAEDPRKELVQKLLEYQKYQEAAKNLYDRPLLGRDIWARGVRENLKAQTAEEEIVLEENALFSLISAYRTVMKSLHKKVHQVSVKTQSIASRIKEIKQYLILGQKIVMQEILMAATDRRKQLLITFLSVLELAKMGFIHVYQNENYGEIYVETTKDVTEDAISRVEEYDAMNAEEVVQNILTEAAEESEALVVEDVSAEEFELHDEPRSEEIIVDDIATDDDILAAELEMDSLLNQELRGENGQES